MSNNYFFSSNQIHIPILFSMPDVLYMESYIINCIKLAGGDVRVPRNHYYIEIVALYLYDLWMNETEKAAKDKHKENLLLYLLPLIDKILRGHTKFLNGLDYADIFQDLCVHTAEQISRYQKDKGKLFSFLTSKIQWHIKTITLKNTHAPKDQYLSDYEVGYEADSNNNHYIDFLDLLIDVLNRENVEDDYKLVYFYIYDKIDKQDLRALLVNATTEISRHTNLSRNKVSDALSFLKDEYGNINISNKIIKYSRS